MEKMVSGKSLIKYFLAGGIGGGIINFALGYTGILGYLYSIPYLNLVFSIGTGITTLIAGIILDFIFKD